MSVPQCLLSRILPVCAGMLDVGPIASRCRQTFTVPQCEAVLHALTSDLHEAVPALSSARYLAAFSTLMDRNADASQADLRWMFEEAQANAQKDVAIAQTARERLYSYQILMATEWWVKMLSITSTPFVSAAFSVDQMYRSDIRRDDLLSGIVVGLIEGEGHVAKLLEEGSETADVLREVAHLERYLYGPQRLTLQANKIYFLHCLYLEHVKNPNLLYLEKTAWWKVDYRGIVQRVPVDQDRWIQTHVGCAEEEGKAGVNYGICLGAPVEQRRKRSSGSKMDLNYICEPPSPERTSVLGQRYPSPPKYTGLWGMVKKHVLRV